MLATEPPRTPHNRRVHALYAFGIAWTAGAMVFSNLLMSLGAFALLLAWGHDRWALGPLFKGRDRTFIQESTVLLAVVGLMGWQVLGLAWTEDLGNGLQALRIKLPFLAFPLILLTGRFDRTAVWRWLPGWWAAMVALGCLVALARGWLSDEKLSARNWSPFISHIRFSLMIVTSWGWLSYRLLRSQGNNRALHLVIWGLLTAMSGLFLRQTGALTGVVLAPIVAAALVGWGALDGRGVSRRTARRWMMGMGGVGGMGLAFLLLNLRPVLPDLDGLPERSAGGELYVHHPDRCLRENGHHVWTHIAWGELQRTWNTRSSVRFYALDGRNQQLRMTLIRYMTSRGLTKDSLGVAALRDVDVARIESGVASILEIEHSGLRRRWDVLKFEVDAMCSGLAPSGQSVMQRWAFLKTGWYIFHHSPAWGVGTGDLDLAFHEAYNAMDSSLAEPFRLRAHNQFLSFALGGGPVGAMLFLSVFVALVATSRRHELAGQESMAVATLVFALVFFLSCWTEDTLETQAGVTWAGLWVGLLGRKGD